MRIIARKGKVYRLTDNLQKTLNATTGRLDFQFRLYGIGESSTFKGFCVDHENLFIDFERYPIEAGNDRQAARLYLRTVGYEYARKRREALRWTLIVEELASYYDAGMPMRMATPIRQIETHMQEALVPALRAATEAVKTEAYEALESSWFVAGANIGASCSSCLNSQLSDFVYYAAANPGASIPFFSFNVLPNVNETNIVATWLRSEASFVSWLPLQLADPTRREICLNKLMFCESEDSCVNPDLWESFDDNKKHDIIKKMHHVFARGILLDSLVPTVVSWPAEPA